MVTRDELRRSTHARVRSKAGELFQERGFAATTVRDIAASAGVSAGTVIAVGDKNRLLVSYFDDLIEQVHRERHSAGAQTPPSDGVTCPELVMELLQPFVSLFMSQADLARVYASILVAGNHHSMVFTELAALLVDEIQAVLVRHTRVSEAEAAQVANAIYLAYIGMLFTWSARTDDNESELLDALNRTVSAICPDQEASA